MSIRLDRRIDHRSVLAIAIPIMASNVTEALIGVVDTAVMGRLPEPYYIGAVAIGALIFSFIYSAFSFLRMGTGGLTAQAYGAADADELEAVIGRSLLIAGAAGFALIIISPLLSSFAFSMLQASEEVEHYASVYFHIRIVAAPFALANFCILGWFIGMSRARMAFLLQLFLNVTNMLLAVILVLGLGMTAAGAALATLIAEIAAALLGMLVVWRELKRRAAHLDKARIFDQAKLKRTLAVNRDIMIRTLCLSAVYWWHTSQGAKAGDLVVAANTVLLHFFEVATFLIDGFAFAVEALVGQSVGAHDPARFHAAIRVSTLWAYVVGLILALIIYFAGPWLIDAMTIAPDVRAEARRFLIWAAVAPLIGVACFQLDGIYVGATRTADMRNMMIISLLVYFAAWWVLTPPLGNTGLWLALLTFFIIRAITLGSRLPALARAALPAQA